MLSSACFWNFAKKKRSKGISLNRKNIWRFKGWQLS
jgi:hypothetical protein